MGGLAGWDNETKGLILCFLGLALQRLNIAEDLGAQKTLVAKILYKVVA